MAKKCQSCNLHFKSDKALSEHLVEGLSCRTCHVTFCSSDVFLHHIQFGSQKCMSHLLYNWLARKRKEKQENKHFKENKTRNLKCNQCNKTFQFLRHYDKHMEGHSRNNCQYCDALYTNRRLLAVHLAEKHNIKIREIRLPCKFCNEVFAKHVTLHWHYHQHANGQKVCLVCGQFLQTKKELEVHTQKHKNNKKWTNVRCKETFIRTQHYQYHLKSQEKYKREESGKNFADKSKLKDHRQSIDNCASKKEPCREKILQPQQLMPHNLTCTGQSSHECKQCGKLFPTAGSLTKHLVSRHEMGRISRTFKCSDCDLEFTNRHSWDRHIRGKHKKTLTYKCEHCDQAFKFKENLKRHLALHTEDPRFVCEHCAAAFHSLNALKDHVSYVHSQIRDYVCAECGMLFKRNKDLNRHMVSHSEVRPFVCVCGNSYKRSSHLRRHKESAHGEVLKSHRLVRLKQTESGSMVPVEKEQKAKRAKKKQKILDVSPKLEQKQGEELQDVSENEGNESKKEENRLPDQLSLVVCADSNSSQPLSLLCSAVGADVTSLLPVVDASELGRMCVTSDGDTITSGCSSLSGTDALAVHCGNENTVSPENGLHTLEVSYVRDCTSQPLYTVPSAEPQLVFSNTIPVSLERAQTVFIVTLDPVLESNGALKIPDEYSQGKDNDGLLLDQSILSDLQLEGIPDTVCMPSAALSHPSTLITSADTILNSHSTLLTTNSSLNPSEALVSTDTSRNSNLISSVDPVLNSDLQDSENLLSVQSNLDSHRSVSPYSLQTNPSSIGVSDCCALLTADSSHQDDSSPNVEPVSIEARNTTSLSTVTDFLHTNYSF